jgi:hypothetical protein
MKIFAIIAAIIIVSLGLSHILQGRSQKPGESKSSPEDIYQGLRNLAFQNSRAKLGLPQPTKPTQPWGAIMDWGVTNGTATVVAYSDGSASVYLSSGGGYLGGFSHESIRTAAQKMIAMAAESQSQTHATTVHPLPQRGQVIFYLLTDQGLFTANASQEELSSHRHPLSKLGDAAQDVITQYRIIQ